MLKRKLWITIGTAAVIASGNVAYGSDEGGESGEAGSEVSAAVADAENFYGKTLKRDVPFSKALNKVLAGEGGEGGIGFSTAGDNFTIPSLTTKQLKAALVGRTIRKDQAVAIYFSPDGNVEGWKRDWSKASSMDLCPTALGDDHEVYEGECWVAAKSPIVGSYTFKNNAVCMPAYSGKKEDGSDCYHIGFLLKYVVIGNGKRMFGSGKDLVDGKELAAFMPRLK